MHFYSESRSDEKTYGMFGVQLQFLIPPLKGNDQISMNRGMLPPGILVPLHSHPEPELFYVLDGSFEIYRETDTPNGWLCYRRIRLSLCPAA